MALICRRARLFAAIDIFSCDMIITHHVAIVGAAAY